MVSTVRCVEQYDVLNSDECFTTVINLFEKRINCCPYTDALVPKMDDFGYCRVCNSQNRLTSWKYLRPKN